eukprot:SAG31_NODE_14204_length_821_cov_0.757618_2_plen_22_part_01
MQYRLVSLRDGTTGALSVPQLE